VHLVTRSDVIGGAHIHVRDLCMALKDEGHQVRVLVGGAGPFLDELEAHGIEREEVHHMVREISPVNDALALLHIRRRLKDLNPDLLSTHSSKAGWLGRFAARSLRIPVTFTVHGWAFTDGIPWGTSYVYAAVERLAAPLASKIITVSNYDKELAVRRGVASERRMVT